MSVIGKVVVERFAVPGRVEPGEWVEVDLVGHVVEQNEWGYYPYIGIIYVSGPSRYIEYETGYGEHGMIALGEGHAWTWIDIVPGCTKLEVLKGLRIRFLQSGIHVIEAVAGIYDSSSGRSVAQDRRRLEVWVGTVTPPPSPRTDVFSVAGKVLGLSVAGAFVAYMLRRDPKIGALVGALVGGGLEVLRRVGE